jgi:hypothetical protein
MDNQYSQLTIDQINQIVDLLFEQHGKELSRDCFAEYLLDIFEDVAGLESTPDNIDELIAIAYQNYIQLP